MDSTEAQISAQAQAHIYDTTFNFINSMALKSAVQLGIPDAIHRHGKPITLPQLGAALDLHPAKSAYIHRLMRVLIHSGFFAVENSDGQQEEDQQEAYVLTPSSKLLVKDNPICLSSFVMFVLRHDFVTPCQLGDWIIEDPASSLTSTPFEKIHGGMPFYEYKDLNPEFSALFDEALAVDSRTMNLVVGNLEKALEGIDSLIDVGGGTGTFARIIAEAFPRIKCKVLELPQVAIATSGNLAFVHGDMFQLVPSADAVVLRSMLHGWKDEDCVRILKKCRDAIPNKGEGGEVIIIDIVMNEKNDEHETDWNETAV